MNPSLNYGFWLIMMHQCWLLNFTNIPAGGHVDGREEGTVLWDLSVLLTQLGYKLKKALNNLKKISTPETKDKTKNRSSSSFLTKLLSAFQGCFPRTERFFSFETIIETVFSYWYVTQHFTVYREIFVYIVFIYSFFLKSYLWSLTIMYMWHHWASII